MSETSLTQGAGEAVLEVVSPDGARRYARVGQSPFLIGRGADTGNHLQLSDRRISRQCAAIVYDGGSFSLQGRGQRPGVFVNGQRIVNEPLDAGDVISFGDNDTYSLIFRSSAGGASIQ